MTIPKVTRDLLMLAPSFNLSPTAPLALARSLRKRKYIMSRKSKQKKPLTLSPTRQFKTVSILLGLPSSRSIQVTTVPTLGQQRRGVHMTLYHQDPVATLSRPSEGASQVGAPQVSQTSNMELQYIAASSPPVTTGTLKSLSIYQVSLLHKN